MSRCLRRPSPRATRTRAAPSDVARPAATASYGEPVDHAKLNGVALARRQLGQRLVQTVQPDLVRLGRRTGLVEPLEEPDPLARRQLDPPAAHGLREQVPRDAEEPRARRPARAVAEAPTCEPRLRERLRGQVVRRVRVARARRWYPCTCLA